MDQDDLYGVIPPMDIPRSSTFFMCRTDFVWTSGEQDNLAELL